MRNGHMWPKRLTLRRTRATLSCHLSRFTCHVRDIITLDFTARCNRVTRNRNGARIAMSLEAKRPLIIFGHSKFTFPARR